MIGDGAVHCIRSHQNKLTNSLVLALGRDHLQSILEAFGKLWTRRAWRDPTLDTDVVLESKEKGPNKGSSRTQETKVP